jgi:type II secretory pathway pseudopilin PulG
MSTLDRVEAVVTRRFSTKNHQKGTLLLDTLIAMSILAIVFAIAYPNYAYARSQSQVAASGQQMNAIASALEMYANDHSGVYPANGNVAPALFGGNSNPYMLSTPISPSMTQVTGLYVFAAVTQANGTPGYVITDPASYPTTLLNGYKTAAGVACTACTKLYYNNSQGIYGG